MNKEVLIQQSAAGISSKWHCHLLAGQRFSAECRAEGSMKEFAAQFLPSKACTTLANARKLTGETLSAEKHGAIVNISTFWEDAAGFGDQLHATRCAKAKVRRF